MITHLAASLRLRAGLVEPAYSTSKILRTWFPRSVVLGHPLPPDIDEAVTRTVDGVVIVYRRGMSIGERRFAVSHAIGHLMFDGVRSTPMFRGRGGDAACELRADAFAAELLVPLDELQQRMLIGLDPDGAGEHRQIYLDHCDELASIFKVTATLIDQRIRELFSLLESG